MYEKEFKIKVNGKEETFMLKPLGGKHIAKFYKLISKLETFRLDTVTDTDKVKMASALLADEEVINIVYDLTKETLLKSYKDKYDEETLDLLVSRNILAFLGPVLEVNAPQA